MRCDNKLGLPVMERGESGWQSPCSLRIFVSKIGWDREISLRTWYINQLERFIADGGGEISAHAPSQFGFKYRSTIHWTLQLEWDIAACWKSASILCLAIKMASNDEKLTKCCCILLWYCCLKLTINQNVFAFALIRCFCSFATGWKALHVLFELKQLAECKSRAADMLVVLAECKPRFTNGSRVAGKVFGELSVAAVGCSAKDSSSDFYHGMAQENLLMGQEPLARYFGSTVGCSNWLLC